MWSVSKTRALGVAEMSTEQNTNARFEYAKERLAKAIAEKDIEVGNEIVTLSGYMCPDCRMTQCDDCDRDVLDDYEIFDNKTVCLDCCQSKYGWQECSDCEILNPVQDNFLELEDRVMIKNDKGGYICHDCMAE